MCIAPLTPSVMTMRGATCHSCALITSISRLYLIFFSWMACYMYLWWVNVHSSMCIVWLGSGAWGHFVYSWLLVCIRCMVGGLQGMCIEYYDSCI